MKKLKRVLPILTLVFSTAMIPFGYAHDGEHTRENGMQGQGMKGGMHSQSMMGNNMAPGQAMPMHEHMHEMQVMMGKIKTEKDPEKRQKMIFEHMQSMQQGMQMISTRMEMNEGKQMTDMDMDMHREMMVSNMQMMQMMMGQMTEHQAEVNKTSEDEKEQ